MLDGKAKDFLSMLKSFVTSYDKLHDDLVEARVRRVQLEANFAIQVIRDTLGEDSQGLFGWEHNVLMGLLEKNMLCMDIRGGRVQSFRFNPEYIVGCRWCNDIASDGGYAFTLDKLNKIAAHVKQHGWNDAIDPIVVKESVAAQPADDTDVMMAN